MLIMRLLQVRHISAPVVYIYIYVRIFYISIDKAKYMHRKSR